MLVFVGDLVDRGPRIAEVLDAAMTMVRNGTGLSVVGNHDDKLHRALIGRNVKIAHGLADSLEQLGRLSGGARERIRDFIAGLPGNLVLDEGRLVVAHAGLPERHHGDQSTRARDLAMYGPTRPGRDEHGLPIRLDWTSSYRGEARVVYGHTPVVRPEWRGNTLDVDTGCAYGGLLSAYRYPEGDIVSVAARFTYAPKGGPFRHGGPGGRYATPEELAAARVAAGGEPVAPPADRLLAGSGSAAVDRS
jgi:protein phosphatase